MHRSGTHKLRNAGLAMGAIVAAREARERGPGRLPPETEAREFGFVSWLGPAGLWPPDGATDLLYAAVDPAPLQANGD